MKHFQCYSILLLLAVAVGCGKEKEQEYEFTVVFMVSPGVGLGPSADVVVSDDSGKILQAFEIKENETTVTRTVQYTGEKRLTSVNIHLGFRADFQSAFCHIYSHIGVQDGVPVVFEPAYFQPGTLDQKAFRITGVNSVDSLGVLGGYEWATNYDPSSSELFVIDLLMADQGAVLHGKLNGSSSFQYLYRPPDSIMQGTIAELKAGDFKVIPAPQQVTISPSMPTVYAMDVDAIFPDFKHFVSTGPGTHLAPSNLEFILPEELPKTLRIHLTGDGFEADRIFPDGAALQFEMPDIQINSATTSDDWQDLNIQTTGDIDYLQVISDQSPHYLWKLEGAPEAFKNLKLPSIAELSRYIPLESNLWDAFWRFKVRALQFGKHNYADVREGYPYRSNELFPVAQSGFFMLERSY